MFLSDAREYLRQGGRERIGNGYCEDVTCLAQPGFKGSPYRQAAELASMPASDIDACWCLLELQIPEARFSDNRICVGHSIQLHIG